MIVLLGDVPTVEEGEGVRVRDALWDGVKVLVVVLLGEVPAVEEGEGVRDLLGVTVVEGET